MASIELSGHEMSVLADVLESHLSGLTSEIQHTDARAFRDGLKAEATCIKRILERLEERKAQVLT